MVKNDISGKALEGPSRRYAHSPQRFILINGPHRGDRPEPVWVPRPVEDNHARSRGHISVDALDSVRQHAIVVRSGLPILIARLSLGNSEYRRRDQRDRAGAREA